jgi:fructose-1,6-bisphosphatase/inositol monophosphatase family enzyme
VASGRVDAYYERGVNHWDYAAGGLVATEAGALLGGLAGKPAGTAMTIAAEPALFGQLCDVLAGLRADRDA